VAKPIDATAAMTSAATLTAFADTPRATSARPTGIIAR
jgi:hypothetical protein